MNIGFIIQNSFPTDREVRTRKMARSLYESGHDITIYSVGESEDTDKDNVPYANIRGFGNTNYTKYITILCKAIPGNPLWIIWLLFHVNSNEEDVIISADLRAGVTTAAVANILKTPMFVDSRESYEELTRDLGRSNIVYRLLALSRLVFLLEYILYESADTVIVVTKERKYELKERLPHKDIIVVSNVPDLRDWSLDREDTGYHFEGKVVIYIGIISKLRGIENIIETMYKKNLKQEGVHLVIGGDGPDKQRLEKIVDEKDLQDAVTFTGWIDSSEIPGFIRSGDIGIIPHRQTKFTNETIPNKLFDYMLAGIPVLSSDLKPVSRVLSETTCGMTVDINSDEEVVSRIRELMERKDIMGRAGRQAVLEKYNWSNEMKILREKIEGDANV